MEETMNFTRTFDFNRVNQRSLKGAFAAICGAAGLFALASCEDASLQDVPFQNAPFQDGSWKGAISGEAPETETASGAGGTDYGTLEMKIEVKIGGLSTGAAGNARTAAPASLEEALVSYTVEFESETATHSAVELASGSEKTVTLEEGEWTVSATGYAGSTPAAHGSAQVTISAGQKTSARITVLPLTTGTGTFSWSVAGSEIADSAVLSLSAYTGGAVSGWSEKNLKTAPSGSFSLTGGYYIAQVSLAKTVNSESTPRVAARTEVLHIYPGLETHISASFADSDFLIDTTAPVISGTDAADLVTAEGTSATLHFTSSEAGAYYYLVLLSAATAPSASFVKLQGAAPAKGSGEATGLPQTLHISGLAADNPYTAYIVVEDAAANLSEVCAITGVNPQKLYTWNTPSLAAVNGLTPQVTFDKASPQVYGTTVTATVSFTGTSASRAEYVMALASSSDVSLTRTSGEETQLVEKDGTPASLAYTFTLPHGDVSGLSLIMSFTQKSLVTYHANGGGEDILVYVTTGDRITLIDGTGLTAPSAKVFTGWSDNSYFLNNSRAAENPGAGTLYTEGFDYGALNADLDLYALWRGDGSTSPAEVWDADTLSAIGTDTTSLSNKYILIRDIGSESNPVRNPISGEFAGTFDGNGHTVTLGISINAPSVETAVGLFSTIKRGTVQNMRVTGTVTVTGATAAVYVGGIAGSLSASDVSKGNTAYNSRIQNVVSEIAVSASGSSKVYAGGVVGQLYHQYIERSGYTRSYPRLLYAIAAGTVSVTDTGSTATLAVGGIAGAVAGDDDAKASSYFQNCAAFNTAAAGDAVTGANAGRVWGLLSTAPTTNLTSNYAIPMTVNGASVSSGTTTDKDGGNLTCSESFFTTASNWTDAAWDFTSIWVWDSSANIPKLR